MSTRARLMALICTAAALFISRGVCADSPDVAQFDSLQARWLSLRNTDVEVGRRQEWIELARDFSRLVDRYPRSVVTPRALYSAATLYREVGRKHASENDLLQSVALLNRLIDLHPADVLADDALMLEADIFGEDFGYDERRDRLFRSIIERYPRSDMAQAARVRMRDAKPSMPPEVSATPAPERVPAVAKGPVVVIDPGHGGEDFGAVGVGGMYEKDVALAVALEVERLLAEDPSLTVFLTRRHDEFVPLVKRMSAANSLRANLFLSIHTNASPQHKLSGVQTFYLDNAGDQASRLLAERENASIKFEEGSEAGDLNFILSDLIQNAKLEESARLARTVQQSLIKAGAQSGSAPRDLGVRAGPFYVLVGAHMPCVLVEIAFIDHPLEGAALGRKEFRSNIASGLAAAIREYLRKESRR